MVNTNNLVRCCNTTRVVSTRNLDVVALMGALDGGLDVMAPDLMDSLIAGTMDKVVADVMAPDLMDSIIVGTMDKVVADAITITMVVAEVIVVQVKLITLTGMTLMMIMIRTCLDWVPIWQS